MRFDKYPPSDLLKPFIRQFVISEAEAERTYKVLPGTSLVIGLQYSGRLLRVDGSAALALSGSGITGLHDSSRMFRNSTGIGTVLVYFNEGAAGHFFRQPVHELFGESVSLDNFMLRSELVILEEQLCSAKNDLGRIRVVERFLISRMDTRQTDAMVLNALALINASKGNIRIRDLAKQLRTSQSPLEKRFRAAVGASPKKFASIIRFRNTIASYSDNRSLTALGYDAGFYDQAHFIREFRHFTGDTPEEFFRENAGPE